MSRSRRWVDGAGRVVALALVLLGAAARAEGRLAIRVQEFDVTDPRRVAEIQAIEQDTSQATRSDAEAISREFWRSGFQAAAEQAAREGGPHLSEAEIEEMLADMGFDRGRREDLDDLTRRAERIRRGSEDMTRRLFAVTRGLQPKVEQHCVVGVRESVEAAVEEGWRTVTHHYRLEWLGANAARLAIWEEAGSGLDELAREQAVAGRHPLMEPILRGRSGSSSGETTRVSLIFMELRPAGSGTRGCQVRYPADGRPPERRSHPFAPRKERGGPSRGPAAGGYRSITPR